ncbi:YigZ family protein [soil metagenome]
MIIKDSYLTIKAPSEFEIKVEKSKFIANSFPFSDPGSLREKLKTVKEKYFDASHHPYGYKVGRDENNFRYSDDGEPSGSSGKPVYDAIIKNNLSDVLVTVTRYFGGIKLGVGGLKRAYFEAADLCLIQSKVIEKIYYESLTLFFDYKYMNNVIRMLNTCEGSITDNRSGEEVVLDCKIRLSKVDEFKENYEQLTFGSGKIIFG